MASVRSAGGALPKPASSCCDASIDAVATAIAAARVAGGVLPSAGCAQAECIARCVREADCLACGCVCRGLWAWEAWRTGESRTPHTWKTPSLACHSASNRSFSARYSCSSLLRYSCIHLRSASLRLKAASSVSAICLSPHMKQKFACARQPSLMREVAGRGVGVWCADDLFWKLDTTPHAGDHGHG